MKIALVGLGYVSAGFCVSGPFPISYLNDRVFVLGYDCLLVNQRMSSDLETGTSSRPGILATDWFRKSQGTVHPNSDAAGGAAPLIFSRN